jgi:beta-mannosidase
MDPMVEARLDDGLGRAPHPRKDNHRDPGAAYDMEDIRDVYTEDIFGVRPTVVRRSDADLATTLFRATVAEVYEHVLSEWRRPESPCMGVMPLQLADLHHGQDLGMLDILGRPKAPWYVMRRLMKPVALLLTDEGFNGLGVHIVNDTQTRIEGVVRIDLYRDGAALIESADVPVQVAPQSGRRIDVSAAFGSFRDLTYAYRFGSPVADVVAVTLQDASGCEIDSSVHLPAGPRRPRQRDVGLSADLQWQDETWVARLQTDEFAQWVSFEVPGWRPEDSWFHLLPGRPREVGLLPESPARGAPRGSISALNSIAKGRLRTGET